LRLVFKILGLMIFTIIIFISGIAFFALQSEAQFKNNNTVNVQAATQSKVAAKRFINSLKNKQQPVLLSLSQTEINGLSALLYRAFPQISSVIVMQNQQAIINFSIELPLPKAFQYLNISAVLLPSNSGINLGEVKVGNLTISGNQLVGISRWFINEFVQEDLGTKLVSMVQWVTINQNKIHTSLLIPQEMNELKQGESSLIALRDNLALFGDVPSVKFYYAALVEHLDLLDNPANKNRHLTHYIQFMFSLAQQQTLLSKKQQPNQSTPAVHENYSALMALALYFGSNRFELLVGDISHLTTAQSSKRNFLANRVTLRGRVDLQKHFMYSIAFQLFGNSSASDAIGELKEFLDSNPGGSGFSFADLMADRAGTRLAKIATESEETALWVQQQLSQNIVESDFMPEIADIPEGLSAIDFTNNYRDVDSAKYRNMLQLLDKRLAALTLYQ